MALILAALMQQTPDLHVERELQKIEALAPQFAPPNSPEYEHVNACKNVMNGLAEWSEKDAVRIRAVSEGLAKLLARKGKTRAHEYDYLWRGGSYLAMEPPKEVAWLDGIVDRVDSYRKAATPAPRGREQVDAEMAIMAAELLQNAVHPPMSLKSREISIDWESWDALKRGYTEKRPALRYDPGTKKYVW